MKNIINKYIDKLTLSDVNKFAIKNDIHLNNDELTIIYNYLKNDWESIIYNNEKIFNDLKKNISKENYIKIIDLFNYYKNIYL